VRHIYSLVFGILGFGGFGTHCAGAQPPAPLDSTSPPRQDSLTVLVGLSIPQGFGIPKPLRADYLLNAQSIASSFEPPHPWRLPHWPGTHTTGRRDKIFNEPFCICLGLEGFLVVRLSAAGRVQSAVFTTQSRSPDLGTALLAAARRADSLGLLLAPASKHHRRSDTTMVLQVGSALARASGFVPIARLRLLSHAADKGPRAVNIPLATLPDTGRVPATSGSVILQYDIDTDGHANASSVSVLYSDDPAFSHAAVDLISRADFIPATAQGRPLRSRVMQRLEFRNGVRMIRIPFATVRP
jgi:TonB-like protein